jgi:CubicO group peptidase (beta-lactamase class C family)
VETAVKENGSPSVAVGLVYDQELIWSHGVGPVDRSDPSKGTVNAKTGFRIASITKIFPVLMLRQLYERGLVSDMRDPVAKYEKRFRYKSSFTGEITLEQLAAHTAGLAGRSMAVRMEPPLRPVSAAPTPFGGSRNPQSSPLPTLMLVQATSPTRATSPMTRPTAAWRRCTSCTPRA